MQVSLERITPESRQIVDNLFQYYLYDMSEYMKWSPDESGLYSYNPQLLDPYWENDDHYPFFIIADSEIAGFALVRKYPSDKTTWDMGQFFILRKFKGHGIGKIATDLALKSFTGKWLVRVLPENTGAFDFWKSVISKVVGENYSVVKEKYQDITMNFIRFEL